MSTWSPAASLARRSVATLMELAADARGVAGGDRLARSLERAVVLVATVAGPEVSPRISPRALSPLEAAILETLEGQPPMTSRRIRAVLEERHARSWTVEAVRLALGRLTVAGRVERVGRGHQVSPYCWSLR